METNKNDFGPIRKVDPEDGSHFIMVPIDLEMDIVCSECMNVYRFKPFGLFLKEKNGKMSLSRFVAPIEPYICPSCKRSMVDK
jgi:hypothetical protein